MIGVDDAQLLIFPPPTLKSRLAREAKDAAQHEGAFVDWVQATRSGAAVPLAAMADLVPEEVRSDDVVALIRRCGEEFRARAGSREVVIGVDGAQCSTRFRPRSSCISQRLDRRSCSRRCALASRAPTRSFRCGRTTPPAEWSSPTSATMRSGSLLGRAGSQAARRRAQSARRLRL